MGSEHHIAIRKGKKNQNARYRLQISSKEMCSDLCALGISTKKAHTVCFPSVPSKFLSNFVRGYFDGDGNVWSGDIHIDRKKQTPMLLTAFTSCSKKFLEGLRDALHSEGIGNGSLFFTGNVYRLQYGLHDSIMLYRILYRDDVKLHLLRKRNVYEEFIKMRV